MSDDQKKLGKLDFYFSVINTSYLCHFFKAFPNCWLFAFICNFNCCLQQTQQCNRELIDVSNIAENPADILQIRFIHNKLKYSCSQFPTSVFRSASHDQHTSIVLICDRKWLSPLPWKNSSWASMENISKKSTSCRKRSLASIKGALKTFEGKVKQQHFQNNSHGTLWVLSQVQPTNSLLLPYQALHMTWRINVVIRLIRLKHAAPS